MKKIILSLSLLLTLFACDVAKNVVGNAYNLFQCEYEYKSISGLTLNGVNLQDVNSITSLNPLSAASLLAAVSGGNSPLPLNFTLNLNVKNSSAERAALSGLQYVLLIDDVQMTEGFMTQALSVSPGGTSTFPIQVSFDLREVLSGKSADAVKNMAFNFVGLGDTASRVTVKLRPSMMIGEQNIISPVQIPISFTYGKGHK